MFDYSSCRGTRPTWLLPRTEARTEPARSAGSGPARRAQPLADPLRSRALVDAAPAGRAHEARGHHALGVVHLDASAVAHLREVLPVEDHKLLQVQLAFPVGVRVEPHLLHAALREPDVPGYVEARVQHLLELLPVHLPAAVRVEPVEAPLVPVHLAGVEAQPAREAPQLELLRLQLERPLVEAVAREPDGELPETQGAAAVLVSSAEGGIDQLVLLLCHFQRAGPRHQPHDGPQVRLRQVPVGKEAATRGHNGVRPEEPERRLHVVVRDRHFPPEPAHLHHRIRCGGQLLGALGRGQPRSRGRRRRLQLRQRRWRARLLVDPPQLQQRRRRARRAPALAAP
mmetsp:Transcript_16548/g.44051  ORF Transcript_16548/g.44051 Transcript_16548/m.44051 type:complete len:342 (-) Transcript_16548:56-1081(-)